MKRFLVFFLILTVSAMLFAGGGGQQAPAGGSSAPAQPKEIRVMLANQPWSDFIKNLIPDGGVKLIECVKRKQGLILAKGNPKKITCAADLICEGTRFVNRQKGSGTRILMDYLCSKADIDSSKIYGYDREEYTHTSVAALIAAGSADAGLGVYSAAKMYDLDFVHICDEQFDLLISDKAWNLPMIQKLIEVLKSEEFKKRLDMLGGYILENPGMERHA